MDTSETYAKMREKAKQLCIEEFKKATHPEDINRAYDKYLDALGGQWPDFLLSLWHIAYGSRTIEEDHQRLRRK